MYVCTTSHNNTIVVIGMFSTTMAHFLLGMSNVSILLRTRFGSLSQSKTHSFIVSQSVSQSQVEGKKL